MTESRKSETVERSPSEAQSWERRLLNVRTAISFIIGLAVLVLVVRFTNINLDATWSRIVNSNPLFYLLAIVSYICTFPVRGLRWRRLLNNVGHPHLPVTRLTEFIFLSWFVNSIAPLKLGDGYRGYLLKRSDSVSFSRAIGTVFAERVIDLITLVLLLVLSALVVFRGRLEGELTELALITGLLFGCVMAGVIGLRVFGRRFMGFFSERMQAYYSRFEHGTFNSFKDLPAVTTLSFLAWLAEAGRLFFVLHALHVPLTVGAVLFLLTAASLLLIVPTPGGLGAVETGMVATLALLDIPPETALGVALVDRSISFWGLIVTGLPVFILSRHTK